MCVVVLFLMVAIIVSFIFAVNAFWTALNTYTVSFVRSHSFSGNAKANQPLFFVYFIKNTVQSLTLRFSVMNIYIAIPAFQQITLLVDNASLCPVRPISFRRIAACFFTVFSLK